MKQLPVAPEVKQASSLPVLCTWSRQLHTAGVPSVRGSSLQQCSSETPVRTAHNAAESSPRA